MFTQTIVPKSNKVTIKLPDNFVGEAVRLIALVEKPEQPEVAESTSDAVSNRYAKYPRVDLSTFKFDRDEANDFS